MVVNYIFIMIMPNVIGMFTILCCIHYWNQHLICLELCSFTQMVLNVVCVMLTCLGNINIGSLIVQNSFLPAQFLENRKFLKQIEKGELPFCLLSWLFLCFSRFSSYFVPLQFIYTILPSKFIAEIIIAFKYVWFSYDYFTSLMYGIWSIWFLFHHATASYLLPAWFFQLYSLCSEMSV